MAGQYAYEPLPVGRDCIGLVELLPQSFDSGITVRLCMIDLSLSAHAPYTALSYVWGSRANETTICVETDNDCGSPNIRSLKVTKNLYQALQYLRPAKEAEMFWIDALCVNQKDLAERAGQVRLMAQIFRMAASTTVWLGPAADASSHAMSKLQEWFSILQAQKSGDSESQPLLLDGQPCPPDSAVPFDKDNSPDIVAIHALVMRDWFERLSIRQEIYHSSDKAMLVCGSDRMSWTAFRSGLIDVLDRGSLRWIKGKAVPNLSAFWRRLDLIKDMCHPVFSNDIEFGISQMRYTRCEDERDRIYGTIGMMPVECDWFVSSIPVDYKLPVSMLYAEIAKLIIEKGSSLNIIRYCDGNADRWSPTWAPNWSTVIRPRALEEQVADARSTANVVEINNQSLKVTGLGLASIYRIYGFEKTSEMSDEQMVLHIKSLLSHIYPERMPGSQDLMLEDLVSILVNLGDNISLQTLEIHKSLWPP